MTNWIIGLATVLCLAVGAHSDAKELTLDDIFPTDRGDRCTNYRFTTGLGHNSVSVTGFYDSTRCITAI